MNHRAQPNIKIARRLIRVGGTRTYDEDTVKPEIRDWNARVEAEKAAKQLRKLQEKKK